MRDNERIQLERDYLNAVLCCQISKEPSEIYYEARGGLDINLFSQTRVKIADFINNQLAQGVKFEAIRCLLIAKSKDDAGLNKELCEILGTAGIFLASTFSIIEREIRAIIAMNNIARGKR